MNKQRYRLTTLKAQHYKTEIRDIQERTMLGTDLDYINVEALKNILVEFTKVCDIAILDNNSEEICNECEQRMTRKNEGSWLDGLWYCGKCTDILVSI